MEQSSTCRDIQVCLCRGCNGALKSLEEDVAKYGERKPIVYELLQENYGTTYLQYGQSQQFLIAADIPSLSMADSDTQKRFVEQLYRVLKIDSVSQSRLKILRSMTYILEVINKDLHQSDGTLLSGSECEGSLTEGSDIDQMLIMPDITAVTGQRKITVHSGYVFLLETENVRSGYTKLVLLMKGHANDIRDTTRQSMEESLIKVENSKSYLSSEKYKYFYLCLFKDTGNASSMSIPINLFYGNGPCVTASCNSIPSFGIQATECDMALGIQCAEWPLEAEEWFQRKREKSWPSAKMIEAIRKMPCYILPVGDPKSTTQHLEWRFAFVPAERELIWSFNDCQIQCYTILKFLKRNYFNAVASEQLSSFCLKTIVFWISEEEGLEMWTPPNLLECINRCLIRLQESIVSMSLPHYFLRERNLLFSKLEDQEVKQNTMGQLLKIIERLIPSILECHANKISTMRVYLQNWRPCDKNLLTFVDANQRLVPEDPLYFFGLEQMKVLRMCTDLNLSVVHYPTSFQTLLDTVKAIDNLPSDIDRHLVESTRCFLRLRLGMSILAEICLSTNESMKREMISSAVVYFEDGINMDGMCGRLYMSTFHFMSGSREKAERILRDIFSKNMVLFYDGKCGKVSLIKTAIGNQVKVIDNCIKITKSTHTADMVFTSTDVSCVPQGLQYECAFRGSNMLNLNYCFIPPVVYAQYLHFEIAHSSKNTTEVKEALRYLSDAVKNVEGYFEEHRALNLLGLCYSKLGRTRQAVICFVRSLRKTPTVENAASYHLCILVNSSLEKKMERSEFSVESCLC